MTYPEQYTPGPASGAQVRKDDGDKWTLIVNKKTGEWGIPYKYESDELVRVDMKVSKLPSPLENFTIGYDKGAKGCMLQIDWDTTRASVDISPK